MSKTAVPDGTAWSKIVRGRLIKGSWWSLVR
jgi:hypothetical protein